MSDKDAATTSLERTIEDYILIIRERALSALTIALCCSIALAAILVNQPKNFDSASKLMFTPKRENVVELQQVVEEDGTEEMAVVRQIRSQIERLSSISFLSGVAESFTPKEKDMILGSYVREGYKPDDIPTMNEFLEKGLHVSSIPNSYVIEVRFRALTSKSAALVANRIVDQFIRGNIDYTGQRNDAALDFLQEQAEVLKGQLEDSENKLQDFRNKHKLVSLEDSQNIVVERMKSLNLAATEARVERLEKEALINQLDTASENNEDLLNVSYISEYGPIPSIIQEKLKYESQREILNEKYLRKHPRMLENARAIKAIDKQLDVNIRLAIEDARGQYKKALAEEEKLNKELSIAETESLELDRISVDFGILKREVEINKKTYDEVLNSHREVMVSTRLSATNFKVIDIAREEEDPVWPDYKKVGAFSTVLLIVVFFGCILLFELIDNKLKSPKDVESYIGVRFLGAVPYVSKLAKLKNNLKYVDLDSDSTVVESFRAIYSQSQLDTSMMHSRVMLVTSTIPNEGKTTFSSRIARSYARHGFNTLLLDLDFRRPAAHRCFGLKNEVGSLQALNSANQDMESVDVNSLSVQEVEPGLSILPTGGVSKTPTELIDSFSFPTLIHGLRLHYQMIVVDSSPVGVFPDALLIGRYVDELVYVCRTGLVERKVVREIVNRFQNIDLPVLGIVLNAVKKNMASYGYKSGYYANKYRKEYEDSSAD